MSHADQGRPPDDGQAPSGVPARDSAAGRGLRSVDWPHVARRAAVWVLLAALVVIVALLLARVVPRWWGEVVGGLVNGNTALGVWWGLFFGATFTGLPCWAIAGCAKASAAAKNGR